MWRRVSNKMSQNLQNELTSLQIMNPKVHFNFLLSPMIKAFSPIKIDVPTNSFSESCFTLISPYEYPSFVDESDECDESIKSDGDVQKRELTVKN